jgi:hypothetical protein
MESGRKVLNRKKKKFSREDTRTGGLMIIRQLEWRRKKSA